MLKKVRLFAVVFLVIGSGFGLRAQEPLNTRTVDRATYEHFLKGQWKSLINIAEKAADHGIDFYYLQVRTGAAYYYLKKYRKAIIFLEKAYRTDPSNEYVKELLYYSYLLGGRTADARQLAYFGSEKFKEKIGFDGNMPVVSGLSLDLRFENNDDYEGEWSNDSMLTQSVRKDYQYFGVGMEHLFAKSRLYLNYGRVLKKNKIFYPDSTGNNYFVQRSFNQQVVQHQFYVNVTHRVASGLGLSTSFNWLLLKADFDSTGIKQTASYFTGFAGLRKDVGNFKLGVTASVSDLSDKWQFQPGLEATWFPLSNTDLYFYSAIYYPMEMENLSASKFVFKPSMGFRLFAFYLEPSYTFGDLYNFLEADGLIVNNDNDLIRNRLDLFLYGFILKGHLYVYVKYQHYNKVNRYWLADKEFETTYGNDAYTFGVSWRF
jgi:hypothetical protein